MSTLTSSGKVSLYALAIHVGNLESCRFTLTSRLPKAPSMANRASLCQLIIVPVKGWTLCRLALIVPVVKSSKIVELARL